MKRYILQTLAGALLIVSMLNLPAEAQENEPTASVEDARVYIVSPADGETVSKRFTVIFGLEGMGVAPAGIDVGKTGHHHLLVDVNALPDLNEPLPSDANHLHFGGGQTQHTLELEPGEHTLQLILGDLRHRPHDPALVSEMVTVRVE